MANITTIPATIKREKVLRVAAYARVSAAKTTAIESLSAQVDYYTNLVNSNPKWSLVGLYIDEAKSATKEKRDNYLRLLNDCRAGKIDMVITKSVSRFSRNTVNLLSACRELKTLGIDVFFEAQNLHSISREGELILTLLATLAQEEARSDSENMKWRIRKRFEEGKPWSGKVYGYKLVNGIFEIVPKEAEIVRRIFKYYLDGLGSCIIADILNREKTPTKQHAQWREKTIRGMIANPIYIGKLILQTTYSENYITKRKMQNNGELAKYVVNNAHKPIIDEATFYVAQTLLTQRAEKFAPTTIKTPKKTYPFSSKIVCGNCGKNFRRRTNKHNITWTCATFNRLGKTVCNNSKQIPEDILMDLSADVLGVDTFSGELFADKIERITACPGNKLIFYFKDGLIAERAWQDRSRADSWTDSMREQARRARLRRRDLCQK